MTGIKERQSVLTQDALKKSEGRTNLFEFVGHGFTDYREADLKWQRVAGTV